jgi:GT2 family glycosyltransferase
VFTQPNLYLGASRNLAARNARGKYLLFMDDDNLAKPEELDVLVSAAEYSQMDILTCFADAFIKDGEIGNSSNTNRIVFTGADIAAGFFRNPYGDSNCLVLKRSFDALGGFSEDYKIGRDDQEFFSRAILKGFRLQVVPEALYWYKINTSRMRQTQFSQYAGLLRVARPYYQESGFDAHWLDIMRYAQGMSAQKSGLTAKGLKRYAQSNRLRMIAYAFPGLYKWLRPLLRRL